MASSVFVDSPVSTNESRLCGDSQSNLVVVYGKNGLNVDRNGLDSLLEDRNVSSVSVVRLTSPTPSMKDDKEENERMEGDESDLLSSIEFSSKNADEETEIVGLTVEEFYPREEAKKLAKEILNYAGVANPLQIKIDYEFQRFVIQNDHCYTPLTSPSQSKPKAPGESQTVGENKPAQLRQYSNVNKIKKVNEGVAEVDEKKTETDEEEEFSDYSDSSISDSDNDRDSDLDFNVNDRGRRRKTSTRKTRKSLTKTPKKRQSITEKEFFMEDEQRKNAVAPRANRQAVPTPIVQKPLQKVITIAKPAPKPVPRLSISEPEKTEPLLQPIEPRPRVVVQQQPVVPSAQQIFIPQQVSQPHEQRQIIHQRQLTQQRQVSQQQLSQQQTHKPIQQPQRQLSQHPMPQQLSQPQAQHQPQQQRQLPQQQIQRQISHQQPPQQLQLVQQSQAPKVQAQKIYFVKKDTATTSQVMDNTFTDISAMFTRKEVTKPIVPVQQSEPKLQQIQIPTTSVARQIHQIPHCSQMTTKGFMPLGVETAAKNQLPSQISIQTHTSSTDLAIENDKQLDLIDSIVKDEMQKTNVIVKNTHGNEDIPQIVKMLESSESVVMNKAKSIDVGRIATATTASPFTNPAEHFDIANADLLDNPDDDLYNDLLQHVAELRNDKHLQEVIGKQGFATSASSPITISDTLVPLTQSVSTEQQLLHTEITEPQAPIAKKDPIQIVRGDGRVITLPPIEAPTTRAKRRAQSQHVTGSPTPVSTHKAVAVAVKVETVPRRGSAEQRNVTPATPAVKKRVSISSQSTTKEEEFDTEDTQESDSEDDPDKLWCICRQPHNNRFMICCDKCEDWFHGTCVNITKAMGREMEQTGKEWTCPKCVKDFRPKKPVQKKINELFEKKLPGSSQKKQPQAKKSIPNFAKKLDAKKNTEILIKKPTELIQKKLFETVKPIPKQVLIPPLTKSIEVVANKSIENIAVAVPEQPHHQQIHSQQRIKLEAPQAQKPRPPVDPSLLNCIVCKKTARPNSIYCSDDCIRRHAQNALITATKVSKASAATVVSPSTPVTPDEKKKKIPSSFEEALAKAAEPTLQAKNKVERVYVFERKSGRLLTGSNAPTTANLKKWLQDNPTFEVVLPGSPQALAIERSKQKQQPKTPTLTDAPGLTLIKKMPEPKAESTPKVLRPQYIEITRNPATPQLKKYPQQVSLKPPTAMQSPSDGKAPTMAKIQKKQNTTPEQKTPQPVATVSNKESEPIRLNVRKTLKEQLFSRMNEMKLSETARLSLQDIEKFSNETESEMFKLFNKDAGTKYKAKYRSLMFNIKDRKNQSLFQKILERKIEAKQLVKMSPEELASQELAEWRQNENKHQLEMIKKSELDLLSCAKNYVLKTHKGEEVIESKSVDRVSLDISIPVEDVVTVLNNSAVSSTSEVEIASPSKESNRTQSVSDLSQDADSSYNTISMSDNSKATVTSTLERKKSKKQERERDRHHRPKEKHKSSRRRSRSRSRERRHKSPHREERRELNKEEKDKREIVSSKILSNKRDEKKEQPNQDKTEKPDLKPKGNLKHFAKMKERDFKPKLEIKIPDTAKKDYNLIDQILESTKTVEQAANLATEKEKPETKPSSVTTTTAATTAPKSTAKTTENSASADSDQEPTSTVNIPTASEDQYRKYSADLAAILWSGSINMIDVATFQIVIQPVAGVTTDLDKQLPVELDVVGRISPDTVWDYIGKIKKSPNKEIVIIRFVPSCESENTAYSALYMYLDNRKRLGVVKTISPNIKDFYILPLGARKSLPAILQPQENGEFFDDETRPDLLLGIVIRIMGKRPAAVNTSSSSSTSGHHSQPKIARKSEPTSVISKTSIVSSDQKRFTPPTSPKIKITKKSETKSIITSTRLPPKSDDSIDINAILSPKQKITKQAYTADDANEPYSPGGSTDDDELCAPVLPKTISSTKPSVDPMGNDLKRKMDEINRQIEAQKIEIAGMLGMEQKSEAYSPSGSPPTGFKPALDSISIPSNLQQILASIKPSQDSTPTPVPPPPIIGSLISSAADEEYVPIAAPAPAYKPIPAPPLPPTLNITQSSSRLAQLSEAELLSMVPDGMELTSSNSKSAESTRPDSPTSETPNKKPRWIKEPPPPGLEEEFL